MPRVVVFTGQPILAEGLRCTLNSFQTVEFGGIWASAEEFLRDLCRTQPNVAVLDSVSLHGPQFFKQARDACPSCQLVLWAEDTNIETVRHALDLGMSGVISSKSAPEPLVSALLRISSGELYFPDLYCTRGQLAGTAMSARERQLTALIAQGLKNKEIATEMALTEGTVKVYLSRLYRRLGIADRFDLALFGLQSFFGAWDTSHRPFVYPGAKPRS